MKKRSLILLILLIGLFILINKYNGVTKSFFMDFINPIKIAYLKFMNISDSYLQQQKNILKLEKENSRLKKLLIEQSDYIEQLSKIFKILPSLKQEPYESIYIINTISYVKLNRLNEIILTTPKKFKFKESKPYGLLQNDVAAGIAVYENSILYGYLLSNPKCTFSVVIGENKISGVAQGDNKDRMNIKFIPRWSKIEIGDKVYTSGLDNIFYPNIPVGEITDIKILDRYKEARVKVYANLLKPSIFFLVSDPTPYLTTDYIPKTAFPNKVYPYLPIDKNVTKVTQEVNTTQTQEETVEPIYMDEQRYIDIFKSNLIWQEPFKFDKKK